jgi:hypothetical protein
LTFVVAALALLRTRPAFMRYALVSNAALMAVGFLLVGYQLTGYFLGA